jgi:hypothetical protein
MNDGQIMCEHHEQNSVAVLLFINVKKVKLSP